MDNEHLRGASGFELLFQFFDVPENKDAMRTFAQNARPSSTLARPSSTLQLERQTNSTSSSQNRIHAGGSEVGNQFSMYFLENLGPFRYGLLCQIFSGKLILFLLSGKVYPSATVED